MTDTLHTGYRRSEENEIICISGNGLDFTIIGKSSHPNTDIDFTSDESRIKTRFASGGFSMQILGEECVTSSGIVSCMPLFFEQRDYEIVIDYDGEDDISLWHSNTFIRNRIKKRSRKGKGHTVLTGVINFNSDIGYSAFEIRKNGATVIALEIEVYPSKMSYKEDYKLMMQDITDEVYELAFDFLKKTYTEWGLRRTDHQTPIEFFAIINHIFEDMKRSCNILISHAHHELERRQEMLPVHKVKNINAQTIKWMNKHPDKAYRRENGRVGFEKINTTIKQVNFDTQENRLVKHMLSSTQRKLNNFKELYLKRKTVEEHILKDIDRMCSEINRFKETTFLKHVGELSSTQSMSLVFQMAPGYRELYRYYLELQKGLSLNGDIFNMSMKDVATLYEYWCFIKLNKILKDNGYVLRSKDIIKTERKGLVVDIKRGKTAATKYMNPKNGEMINLVYNQPESQTPTINQRPDNVLSLEKKNSKNKYEYVFDAKYRINMALDGSRYKDMYKTPGPEEDTINTMHRYRDAIVHKNGGQYEQSMFGAYVLFPYSNELEYRDHTFYKSIDEVNIGGLPFLPGTTSMVEDFLEELIAESGDSAFERATLPAGIEERLAHVDLSNRNVIVGMVSSREQLDICLKEKFYYIPCDRVSEERLPLEYVAIHQTKTQFGEDAGIKWYGKVKRVKKVQRGMIKELSVSRNNEEEYYYYFYIDEWMSLDKKIEVDGIRAVNYYTNINLLETCDTRQELAITTLDELRLYKELKRITDEVSLHSDEDKVYGFEFNGAYIALDNNLINIHKDGIDIEMNSSIERKNFKYLVDKIIG